MTRNKALQYPESAAARATEFCRSKLSEKEYKQLNSNIVAEIDYAYIEGEKYAIEGLRRHNNIAQLKRSETTNEILVVLFFAVAAISLMRIIK